LLTSNRIVHGLWIGPLTRLERLTLCSFVARGHEFHLWRYERVPDPLPRGVVVRDANEILPRERVFRKRIADGELGLGEGSYAMFADLFRTKLLHELGGIWVDMDVLCLRPFDFEQPYVFRAHRLGAVMNVIKCPPGSRFTGELLEEMSERVDEDSGWFDFAHAFIEGIRRQDLQKFVRDDLMPPDHWDSVRPFVEGNAELNPAWFGLHWMNELWTTLRKTGGSYKGNRIASRVPDKNHPVPGSRLFHLFQQYGLLRRDHRPVEPPVVPGSQLAAVQPTTPVFADKLHLNTVLPSMTLGGAERLVHDVLSRLQETAVTSKLFLLHDVEPCYPTDGIRGCQVVRLQGKPSPARMQTIAAEVLASGDPTVFTHLVSARELEALGRAGLRVVPVIHNSQPAWQDAPQAFEKPWVPFVVTVSEAVKRQMLALGCKKPIVVVRHELQRPPPSAEEAEAERLTVRRRHGIPDDALLIGMVGQFKAQKAYTRAVRVLQSVQQHVKARLMILGGWDHEWGAGRAAYTATCRQALELGVMADVVMPGPVHPVEPYYSAFDVFLNTSIYEGLSIATLEAMGRGCPVVSADAGGNAEALGPTDVLVEDASDVEAYAKAILEVSARPQRRLRPLPTDPDLVPRLWALLGRYGAPETPVRPRAAPATLVVTENLNIGGPQRSLLNLLRRWPTSKPIAVAVLETVYSQEFLRRIQDAGVLVFGLHGQRSVMERCERVLQLVEQTGATTLAFWNAPAALKLALAKVVEVRPLRLVDVSPGPMLRNELAAAGDHPRRLGMSVAEYFARVDCFVAKYAGGLPPELADAAPDRVRVIPNGVPLPAEGALAPLPQGWAPELSVGTCCRIVPSKRLEQLVDVMEVLAQRLPGATLTIVGAADPWHTDYAAYVADKIGRAGLRNIRFVGAHADVTPYLRSFRVFLMLSDDQGCPNASLEAMAAGVPVVANDSGGTAEQVLHGTNGFIVSPDDPHGAASAVETLLRDPAMREAFGAAARRHVERAFPMDSMLAGYVEAFAWKKRTANGTSDHDGRASAADQPRTRHENQDRPS
jgi:glycosyltransferase involved in cell wall biosynthesis